MVRNLSFHDFIGYDRRQLEVNIGADLESCAVTCYHSQQYAEKTLMQKLQDFGAENLNSLSLVYLASDLALLNGAGIEADVYDSCMLLTRYFFTSRYPNKRRSTVFTPEMAADSIIRASEIAAWCNSFVVPEDPAGLELLVERMVVLDGIRETRKRERESGFFRRYDENECGCLRIGP